MAYGPLSSSQSESIADRIERMEVALLTIRGIWDSIQRSKSPPTASDIQHMTGLSLILGLRSKELISFLS
jgi:hypothetical protein